MKKPPFLIDGRHTWINYPSMIKWKIEQRELLLNSYENYFLIETINQSIIIDLSTLIEAITYEIISDSLSIHLKSNDKFQNQLSRYFDEKINSLTWNNYQEFFELLLGEKLSDKINNDTWKGITILFNFRNSLVHGKSIIINYYVKENKEITADSTNRFDKVFKYLNEKKLLDISFKPETNSINLLNNNATKHFTELTYSFLIELINLFPELDDFKKSFINSLN